MLALSPAQQQLAVQMQRMWTNFAGSGNPNTGKPVPHWPSAGATGLPALVLKTSKSKPEMDSYADRHCDLWDRIAGRVTS
jgi:carboxylesterase type B